MIPKRNLLSRTNATHVKLKFYPDPRKQDRINFSIIAGKIRIKQDTLYVTLNRSETDGYALLHDKENWLDLHIKSGYTSADRQGVLKAIVFTNHG